MMKKALIVSSLLMSAGSAHSQESTIRSMLRDPDSARFEQTTKFPNGNSCGIVNAKNGFGGYVGRQPWAIINGNAQMYSNSSYSTVCSHAANPEAAKAAIRANDEAASARCRPYLNEFVDLLFASNKEYFKPIDREWSWSAVNYTYEKVVGRDIETKTLGLYECGSEFKKQVAKIVNAKRENEFQNVCVKGFDRAVEQRTKDNLSVSAGYRKTEWDHDYYLQTCGPVVTKQMADKAWEVSEKLKAELQAKEQAEKTAMLEELLKRQKEWETKNLNAKCSRYLSFVETAKDNDTRKYWLKEFDSQCTKVADSELLAKAEEVKVSPPKNIGETCFQRVAPEMPRRAIREGVSGVVRAQMKIVNGSVTEVKILSGPQVFHEAVAHAIRQYRCQSTSNEIIATEEFTFRLN